MDKLTLKNAKSIKNIRGKDESLHTKHLFTNQNNTYFLVLFQLKQFYLIGYGAIQVIRDTLGGGGFNKASRELF